jgi:amino acid transporter
MSMFDWLLGRRLADAEHEKQKLGPATGIPVLGLDALASAAYGPEAALTLLLPLGAAGIAYVGPISAVIIVILLAVFFSYRQTIVAYPGGGGSYTVAKENLGPRLGLLAGAALALDYILNVAVAIAAGVGALVSAIPSLLPHTTSLCLGILVLLTLVNLRGIRESGLVFMLPTYAFLGTLGAVIVGGLVKTLASGGHPVPITAPPHAPAATEAVSLWILLRAFSNGCTAMTGVEAVSNGVPLFREPVVRNAQRTLGAIIAVLVVFLAGIAYLSRAYGIAATEPGKPGFQSVLSMLAGAVFGKGPLYFLTIGAVVSVLALSANTSFADFPRLCRILANDRFLPDMFAVRGRRLVFTQGIVLLSVLSGALLVAFAGITERLIPLFAIGALLAFTLSQAGMVMHWRKCGPKPAWRSLAINAVGASATGLTAAIVAVTKFTEGAWLTVLVIPLLMSFFARINRHYRHIATAISTIDPLEPPTTQSPIVVLAASGWNKVMQQGLKFALRLSRQVYVVQVKTETDSIEDLSDNWQLLIASRARAANIPEPTLVVLRSNFRLFLEPFVGFVKDLEARHPDRDIAVVMPELVMNNWYEAFLHNNRGAFLYTILRRRCGPRVAIIHTSYRYGDRETG